VQQVDANGDAILSAPGTDSEEESIVVTRQEEEIDPEDEADFEREYAKMMAESLESRKHERKPTFDVPLPMRRKERDNNVTNDSWAEESASPNTPSGTMAFSLLTKRGNRQQVGSSSRSNIYVMILTSHPLDSHCSSSV
jgi:regulator of nonsense transcripts 2